MDGKRVKPIEHPSIFVQPGTIPAFLLKLRNLLDDPDCDHLISWDPDGSSFHLYDQTLFAKEILPQYFKHNNLASFIRQLNMYGFKKISTIEHGGLHSKDDMEFQNPYFVRDEAGLMANIKRKQGSQSIRDKLTEYGALQPTQVGEVLVDVKDLKHTQDNMSEQLDVMKRENSALWREIASLRQKHTQQQHIINKLIQFMMTMASNSRNMKRSLPMIEVGPSSKSRRPEPPNYSTSDSGGSDQIQQSNILSGSGHSVGSSTGHGITIRDITDDDELLSPNLHNNPAIEPSDLLVAIDDAPVPTTVNDIPVMSGLDCSSTSGQLVARSPSSSFNAGLVKTQLSENVHEVQTDIDILRELFSTDSLNVPQDTFMDIFDQPSSGANYQLTPSSNLPILDLDELMKQDSSSEKNGNKSKNQQLSELMSPTTDLDGLIGGMITVHGDDDLDGALKDLIEPIGQSASSEAAISSQIISSNDLD